MIFSDTIIAKYGIENEARVEKINAENAIRIHRSDIRLVRLSKMFVHQQVF